MVRMQKTVKKYGKIDFLFREKIAPCSLGFSDVNWKKRENLRKSFAFASAKYGAVKKSEHKWAKVDTWTLVPSLTLRASLQDDVR